MKAIKNIVYKLIRKWGVSAEYHALDHVSSDHNSGLTQGHWITSNVRILLFPRKMNRDFEYDIAYLASNKNFTYGGTYDVNTRLALLLKKQLPVASPGLDDLIRIEDVYYSIHVTEDIEGALFLTLTRYNKDKKDV